MLRELTDSVTIDPAHPRWRSPDGRERAWEVTRALLADAIDAHRIAAHLQPIIDLASGEVVAVEALARWHDPDVGTIRPDWFITFAERSGQILELGAAILDDALGTVSELRARHPGLRVSVNVSPLQLHHEGLVDLVVDTLDRHALPASALWLELTESAPIDGSEVAASQLRELDRLGVRVLLDDFGRQYATLGSLLDLPFGGIKIPGYFTGLLQDRPRARTIVANQIRLAQELGFPAVAEGVERHHQAELLVELGVQLVQGFLFAAPMPREELDDWLTRWTAPDGPEDASTRGSHGDLAAKLDDAASDRRDLSLACRLVPVPGRRPRRCGPVASLTSRRSGRC